MKKTYLVLQIVVLTLCYQCINAQEQNQSNYNGWEFLSWKCKKTEAENILNKKGIEYSNEESYDSTRTIIKFEYDELDTRLYFDTLSQLNDIKQQQEFSVIYDKESKIFFEKVKKSLLLKYGKAKEEKNDKEKEVITILWKLKYAVINLTFDYKYKIIDEFGCCAYKIEINFSQVK